MRTLIVNSMSLLSLSVVVTSLCPTDLYCGRSSPFLRIDGPNIKEQQGVSFTYAQQVCQDTYGTSLATIDNAEENEFARNLCRDHYPTNCWIGVSYDKGYKYGAWVNSAGQEQSFTDWFPGYTSLGRGMQPDKYENGEEICVYLSSELSINEPFDGHSMQENYFWASGQCDGHWAVRDIAAFLCDNPDYDPENACICECDPNCDTGEFTPTPTTKQTTPAPVDYQTTDSGVIIYTCDESFAVDEPTAICFSDFLEGEVEDGWTNGGVSGNCDLDSKTECTDSFEFPLLVPDSTESCDSSYGELVGLVSVDRTSYFYNCDKYPCDCSTVYQFHLETYGGKNLDELDVVVDSAQVSSVDFENFPVVKLFDQAEKVQTLEFEMSTSGCHTQFYFTLRAIMCT